MPTSSPERTCVGCLRHDSPGAMARFVLDDERIVFDPGGNAPGRGAWVHRDQACWHDAVGRGGFARSFRVRVRVDAAQPPPFAC
ncbi:YlxR family protein [Propionibacterium sp.]|uniref:YlxR family protein n=1 Tax=Propionibacterium sp. TaxID=1977903 RepID=UPI0039EC5AFA